MCTKIFATTKEPSEFLDKRDFEVGSIAVVVDNCATMTALNNKSLFPGNLMPISKHSIIAVSGSDYKPTHIGTAQISVCNDDGMIVDITLPNALYFPTSPVNIISIGQLSQYYSQGSCDEGTHVKSTCDKS